MRFTCPAQLQRYAADEIVVSFRDPEECLTSAATESEALRALGKELVIETRAA